MAYRYSRRVKTEEKRNLRKAILFSVLTLGFLAIFFFYGLPAIVKFAAFLTDIRSSTTPVEVNDTTPPPPPVFDTFPLYTNESEIKLKGRTEPGVNVKLFVNGKENSLLSDSEGEFTYSFQLKRGDNNVSALAVDGSGNESKETQVYKIIFDNEPPELTITKPEDGGEFYGSSERQLMIEGTTEESASVNINGRFVVVDSDGKFTFATTLSEGENNFTVKTQDQAGNSAEETFKVTFNP